MRAVRIVLILGAACLALSGQSALTVSGPVIGRANHGIVAFLGIPYAAPPVGRLRFLPPQPPQPWTKPRKTTSAPPFCPQQQDANGEPAISEDCLKLDVWTPALDTDKRPVMVWIHGGGFIEGGPISDGANLARNGNLVVVEIQYRLGAFGFLELGPISGPGFAESGNLGLLDQIAALRWVQSNIAAFGGDPANVTIFGESAGASSIAALLVVPAARGLFRRAMLESSVIADEDFSLPQATAIARQLMRAADAHTIADLQALSMAALLQAQNSLPMVPYARFGVVSDDVLTPRPVAALLLEPGQVQVPVLIGTNGGEEKAFDPRDTAARRSRADVLRQWQPTFGPRTAAVLATYQHDFPAWDETQWQLATDSVFRIPAIREASAISATEPVWMYLFDYPAPPDGPVHTAEIPYVFATLTGRADNPAGRALSAAMQVAWIAFARIGDPGWPRYDAAQRNTMVFDVKSQVIPDPRGPERLVWR